MIETGNLSCSTVKVLTGIFGLEGCLRDRHRSNSVHIGINNITYLNIPVINLQLHGYMNKLMQKNIQEIPNNAKKIYFLKGMKFSRSEFKNLYPNYSITTNPKNADCVVLPDALHENYSRETILYSQKYNLYIGYKIYQILSMFTSSWYNRRNISFECPIIANLVNDLITEKKDLKIVNNIEYACEEDILISNYAHNGSCPFIFPSQLFLAAKNEFRDENLTCEDLESIFTQILCKDKDVVLAGVNIAASINPKKYGPFLYFLFTSCDLNLFKKSHKGQLLLLYCDEEFCKKKKILSKYQNVQDHQANIHSAIKKIENIILHIKENAFGEGVDIKPINLFFQKYLTNKIKALSDKITIKVESIDLCTNLN